MPYVLWKWQVHSTAGSSLKICSNSRHLVWMGVPGGVGEADVSQAGIKVRSDDRSTRSCGTTPSNPQPNADWTETCTLFPWLEPPVAIAMIRWSASSVDMPVFFLLWVSLAETPMQNMSTPQA